MNSNKYSGILIECSVAPQLYFNYNYEITFEDIQMVFKLLKSQQFHYYVQK